MLRDLWNTVDAVLRFAVAIVAGVLPRFWWARLDTWVPVSRAAWLSGLATLFLAAALAIPAYVEYAEANVKSLSMDQVVATIASSSQALTPFAFAFATPIGLLTTYLALTGAARAISAAVDDPRGDPILSVLDAIVRRIWHAARKRRDVRSREELEGPEVPDRLVPGRAAGFPDADYVVVASRRKPGWEAGAFIITSDKWYRLSAPSERQTPRGLRTLYPLTELRDHEVLRRGVRYALPALSGPSRSDEGV